MINLKLMMPRTRQKIVTIHILPNISRTKDNLAMKFEQFGQRNIFL